jgi:hypothetical protein
MAKREILNCVTGDIHRKLEIRSRLDNPMDVQKRRESYDLCADYKHKLSINTLLPSGALRSPCQHIEPGWILNCVTGDIHRKLEIRSRLDNPMDVQKRREWLKSPLKP